MYNSIYDYIKEMRRELHKRAEAGFLEFDTTVYLIEELRKQGLDPVFGKKLYSERMGLPAEEMFKKHRSELKMELKEEYSEIAEGYTGLFLTLECAEEGEHTLIRSDIDALCCRESSDKNHLPESLSFKSVYEDFMHSCGHDAHMAIALGLIKYINENKDKLKGKFSFIFQSAEEGTRGASAMKNSIDFSDVDLVLAYHIGMGIKSGVIGINTKGFLACEHIEIALKGRASHAGKAPEYGRNSLLAAAQISLAAMNLCQYSSNVARVNVGTLRAGNSRNTVASDACIGIEIRSDSMKVLEDMDSRLRKIAEGISMAYENEYEYKLLGRAGSFNRKNENLKKIALRACESLNLKYELDPDFKASEDVTLFMNESKEAIHFIIGSDIKGEHHKENFDIDENSLVDGYNFLKEFILLRNGAV